MNKKKAAVVLAASSGSGILTGLGIQYVFDLANQPELGGKAGLAAGTLATYFVSQALKPWYMKKENSPVSPGRGPV